MFTSPYKMVDKLFVLVLILSLTNGFVVVVSGGKITFEELQDIVKYHMKTQLLKSHMRTELESKLMEFIPNREKSGWWYLPKYSMKIRPRM